MSTMTRQEYIAFQEKTMTQAQSVYQKALDYCSHIFEPEIYPQFLSFIARWHHFCTVNVLLLHMQRPDAEYVCDFKTWKQLAKEQGFTSGHIIIPESERSKGIALLTPFSFNKIDNTDQNRGSRFLTYKTIVVFDSAQVNKISRPSGIFMDIPIVNFNFPLFLDICRYQFRRDIGFNFGSAEDEHFKYQHAYLYGNRIIYQDEADDKRKIAAVLREIIRFFIYKICENDSLRDFIYLSTVHSIFDYFKLDGGNFSLSGIKSYSQVNKENQFYIINSVCRVTRKIIQEFHSAYEYFLNKYSDGENTQLIRNFTL